MEEPTIVTSPIIWDTPALDAIARAILTDNTAGVSVGDYSAIVLLNDTPELIETAQEILTGYQELSVQADPLELTEGAGDVTITCNDSLIAGDADAGFVVLLDGALYASGTNSITAGVIELTLADPVDGRYSIYIYRLGTSYQSGYIDVVVNEA
jgi:hypothetical protein